MNILADREKTHGDYGLVASVSQALKEALRYGPLDELPAMHRESLEMICVKMARIVCGNHHEPDHWLDVSGYAMLIHQQILQNKKRAGTGEFHELTPDEERDLGIVSPAVVFPDD